MRKNFIGNIVFLILINLIVKPFWVLGIDRNVQNTVGHEVYGKYAAILNISIIFQILLDFGLQAYNTKMVTNNPKAMRSLFPNIVIVKTIFSAIYLVATITSGIFFNFTSEQFTVLFALSFMQIALSYLLFFRSNIAALQKFKIDSIFSVSDRIIAIIIMSVLLFNASFSSNFKIEWYAYVQFGAYSLAAIFAFFVCIKFQKINWKHIKLKKISNVIKASFPYAILVFTMALYMRGDYLILDYISKDSSIPGRYMAAFRYLDVANNMSGVLIAGILLPFFGKQLNNKENITSIIKITVSFLLPLSIFVAIVCIFWGSQILQFSNKNMNESDGKILLWLMLCYPLYCLNYVYSTLLTASGHIKQLIIISIIGVFITLIANFSMLSSNNPLNGIYTAHNAFLTLCIVSFLNLYCCKKYLNISFPLKWALQFIMFIILLFSSAFFINKINLETQNLDFIYKSIILAFVSLILILVTGIIDIKLIKLQIKKVLNKS